jgi:Icc-related predicted phosphoesterase
LKLLCISDIHNQLDKVNLEPADLLLIAGDLTIKGSLAEFNKFNEDVGRIKHLYRLGAMIVFGNHDKLAEQNFNLTKSILTNINYILHDSSVEIEGIKFYGSPYTKMFFNWSFMLSGRDKMKAKWDQIPQCDILITHQPPYGILDEADIFSGHLGCEDLLDAVLRVNPKYHMFGHIHGGAGIKEFNGTTYINASTCTERYEPTNPPIEITIDNS